MKSRLLFTGLLLACAPLPALAQAGATADTLQVINAELAQRQPSLQALYEDIHAHPEIAFQEHRTAALLAQRMRDLGFEVTEGVGRTGVVAVLRNGDGPTVLVRTELDALPMEEKTGLPYASTDHQLYDGAQSPVMHACGHDLHMTWWIGTAEVLSSIRGDWHGTLVFIAQPAEEALGGARAMIDDGLFTRFPAPDYAFAAHVNNGPAGEIVLKDGVVSSASDAYRIVFHGRGGHGSMPSTTIDPIVMAARFVTDAQSIVARERPEGEFGVISVGSFQAGTVANIIPDQATLQMTLRSFDPAVRALLKDGVIRMARASAAMSGAPDPDIIYQGGTGAVMNNSDLVGATYAYLSPALGDDLTLVPAYMPGAPPSEDFSEYLADGLPAVFFNVGGYSPTVIADFAARGEALPSNHSPYFAPDPALAIAPGARTLALAVLGVAGR